MTFRSADRLDPVSRLGLPRSSTLLRTLVIAILLALAAAALYSDPQHTDPTRAVPRPNPPGSPEVDPDGGIRLPAGLVGVPIPLDDAGPLAVLRAGDRVDVLSLAESGAPSRAAASPGGHADAGPTLLATDALVLRTVTDTDRPVLYVALPENQARAVIGVPVGGRYAVIIRPSG